MLVHNCSEEWPSKFVFVLMVAHPSAVVLLVP